MASDDVTNYPLLAHEAIMLLYEVLKHPADAELVRYELVLLEDRIRAFREQHWER